VIVTGHADEIGLIVHHIDEHGFLYVRGLGGVDPATIVTGRFEVHTAKGAIPAVAGRKPIHLLEVEERGKVPKLQNLYLDIGARSKKDAESPVRTGDPVTFAAGLTRLGKDLVTSKALDNRAGVFVAAETLRRLGKAMPKACVIALSTVGEEIGGDGAGTAAFALEPDLAIAIDVTFASDQPDVTATDTCAVTLGDGPTLARGPRLNPTMLRLLERAAKAAKVPVQYDVLPARTGTDGDPIYRSRAGVALAVVGIPCRYMHSPVEVVSLGDLDAAARLLAACVRDLGPRSRFPAFE
jgi:endoglucanase